MYKVFVLLFFIPTLLQAKVLETTLDGKKALVYLPADYDKSKTYTVLLFHPETNDDGSSGSPLRETGPFKYITDTTDLKLDLIIVAFQPDGSGPGPKEIHEYINAIKTSYNTGAVILTGVSGGNKSWMWYAYDSEQDFKKIKAYAIVSGQPGAKEYVSRHPEWFKKYNVRYWGLCGTKDPFYDNQKSFFTAIKRNSPSLASWTEWSSAGHDNQVWGDVYNPAWRANDNHASLYEWAVNVANAPNDASTVAQADNSTQVQDTGDAFEMVLTRDRANTSFIADASYIKPGSKIILTGKYLWIQIKNLNGTPEKPITIVNRGKVEVGGFSAYTIIVTGSNFKIMGNGDPSIKYGIKLNGERSKSGYGGFGIALANSSNVEVANCEFTKFSAGILQAPREGKVMENCYYHDNYMHDFNNPLELGRSECFYLGNTKGKSEAQFLNCRIENNILDSLSGDGIQVCNGTFVIKNNTVKRWGLAQLEAQDNGILVGGFCSASVTGNYLSDGLGIGFQFLGFGNNTVTGNTFKNINTTGGPNAQTRDIVYLCAKSAAVANLNFSNNTFESVKPGRRVLFNGTEPANLGVFKYENNKGLSKSQTAIRGKDVFRQ